MKTILVCTLIMASSPVLAVNKCVIDGRTVYQQAPCPAGTRKAITGGNISSVGSEYLRDQIAAQSAQQAVQQQEQESSAIMDKLDSIERRTKRAEASASSARDEARWRAIRR